MSRADWLQHRADVLRAAGPLYAAGGEMRIMAAHVATGCADCKARQRTRRANRAGRERADALRALGMVKTMHGWE